MITHKDFWQGQQGLDNIKPLRIDPELWESFPVLQIIRRLCGNAQVLEIGCGTGRLSKAFEMGFYFGYDINKTAIEIAAKNNKNYFFSAFDDYSQIDARPTLLLHSAALHIPDNELPAVFRLAEQRIVIGETMSGNARVKPRPKPGLAFHYSRSPNGYAELVPKGFNMCKVEHHSDDTSKKTFTYIVFEKAAKK